MSAPLIVASIGTAAVVGGTVMTAYAQSRAAEAEQVQYTGQQAMADYNAVIAEREALAIEARSLYEQQLQSQEAERYKSMMRAGLGASGVVSSAGTPLLIQSKQAAESELENLMIGFEGQTAASRARSQAKLYRMQSDIYGQQAKYALKAGKIRAGTTLLTGFGQAMSGMGSMWASSGGMS